MSHRLKQKWSSPTDDGTHGSWVAMHARCKGEGSNAHYYSDISVCPEWRDFDRFYKDMGARPEGLTLDRIDPSKGYGPDNCRWATRKEQANNQRRSVVLTHDGHTRTLSAWAEHLGVPYYLLWNRIRKHKHDLAKALTPVRLQRTTWEHGTVTGYTKGCRCAECKAARAAYHLARRANGYKA